MIVYILAIPIFSFALPLYSFWHMDDFSWGNTRVVTGDHGKQVVISDEGKFDPAMIPRKRWDEYQAELWEAHTSQGDARSEYSGISYGTKPAGSEYGGVPPSHYEVPLPRYTNNGSRFSLAPSEMLGGQGMRETREGVELISMELPSDDAILAEIRDILKTADLMTVTKKSIKMELERRFGLSLDAKKAYINSGMFSKSHSLLFSFRGPRTGFTNIGFFFQQLRKLSFLVICKCLLKQGEVYDPTAVFAVIFRTE